MTKSYKFLDDESREFREVVGTEWVSPIKGQVKEKTPLLAKKSPFNN
jgi:hypothetical protein